VDLPTPITIIGYSRVVAAQVLGVSPRTMTRAIARGDIRAVSVTASKLVPPEELRRAIDAGGVLRGSRDRHDPATGRYIRKKAPP
jgi:hypothetical protein